MRNSFRGVLLHRAEEGWLLSKGRNGLNNPKSREQRGAVYLGQDVRARNVEGLLSVGLPPWWAGLSCHLRETGACKGRTEFPGSLFILKAERSFLRYGFLRLILRRPDEMPWREAVNQLEINAKYTREK